MFLGLTVWWWGSGRGRWWQSGPGGAPGRVFLQRRGVLLRRAPAILRHGLCEGWCGLERCWGCRRAVPCDCRVAAHAYAIRQSCRRMSLAWYFNVLLFGMNDGGRLLRASRARAHAGAVPPTEPRVVFRVIQRNCCWGIGNERAPPATPPANTNSPLPGVGAHSRPDGAVLLWRTGSGHQDRDEPIPTGAVGLEVLVQAGVVLLQGGRRQMTRGDVGVDRQRYRPHRGRLGTVVESDRSAQ